MTASNHQRGVALMAVVLVLMALVSIATPFALSMRNQDRSAATTVYREQAQSTVTTGLSLAEEVLSRTAPDRDVTPHWDGADELSVRLKGELETYETDANDPTGSIWSVSSSDEQGRADVNQCSPYLLSNLFSGAFLTAELDVDETAELRISDADPFADQGIVWIEGELVMYRGKNGNRLTGLTRSLDTSVVTSVMSTEHAFGEAVIDYRVLVAAMYPYKASPPAWTPFATVRALKDISRFGEVSFRADEIDGLAPELTTHAVLPASRRFLAPARVLYPFSSSDPVAEVFVSGGHNFGPGTVVRIRAGERVEYNLVVSTSAADENRASLLLQEKVTHSYGADEAIIEALARAPINVNACSRRMLEALVTGLRTVGSNEQVDRAEAATVASAMIAARPIEGEREMSSILAGLESAGDISAGDRFAILLNAFHAGDTGLAFGTAPFVYRSYGVFRMEAAASENLPAGREAARRFARQIGSAIPAGPSTAFFATQIEFEEQMRLSRAGRFWTSWPENLDGGDGSNQPPLRIASASEGRYPALDDDERKPSIQLAPVRQEGRRDAAAWMPEATTERVMHFDGTPDDPQDHRSEDVRGWNFGEAGPLAIDVASEETGLLDEREYVQPFAISLWWTPAEQAGDGMTILFDSGDLEHDKYSDITNRVLLFVDGTELIFRVADSSVPDPLGEKFPGDPSELDPAEIPGQFAEIRYAFDDGLPFEVDVPYHIVAYARGNRPSDLNLMVDNVPRGRRAFQTRLAEDIGPPANAGPFASIPGFGGGQTEKIKVEDATLFPPFGVVRIDHELIEYIDRTDNELIVGRATGDAFGGRARRGSRGDRHLESETVELFGYTAVQLSERITTGKVGMQNSISEFGVAMVDPESQACKNPIETTFEGPAGNIDVQIASGISSSVSELSLVPVGNPNQNIASSGGSNIATMFDRNGGFAIIVSSPAAPAAGSGNDLAIGQQTAEFTWARVLRTPKGELIGLGELIFYQSYDGSTLSGIRRAPMSGNSTQWYPDNQSNLVEAGNAGAQSDDGDATATAGHVHVSEWQAQHVENGYEQVQPIFVVPISVKPGINAAKLAEDYPEPQRRNNRTLPEMVQLGSGFLGTTAGGGTEWVRYDVMAEGCFVRDEPQRIRAVIDMLTRDVSDLFTIENASNFPSGEELAAAINFENIAGNRNDAEAVAKSAGLVSGQNFDPTRMLAFRGVLGTESKSHPAGALVLPVFRSLRSEIWGGRPGARDYVTLVDPLTNSREEQRINYAYCETDVEGWGGFGCHFAFDAGCEAEYLTNFFDLFSNVDPSSPGAAMDALANQNIQSRDITRMLKFPSGELPLKLGEQIYFGGDLRGEPSPLGGVIDEIEWFTPTTPSDALPRHVRFKLSRLDELKETLYIARKGLRYNLWDNQSAVIEAIDPVDNLPKDGVVMLIDDELIGFSDIILDDEGEAEMRVATNGRGFLGTPIQFHPRAAAAREMTFMRVSRLEKTIRVTDSEIVVADAADFPMRGYVQINQEIVGYVRKEGNTLSMPHWINEGSRQKEGLLRGRFGTAADRHNEGTLVVVFNTRTEDRWHPRSDDPELSFFGLAHHASRAYYKELMWVAEGGSPLCDVVVQARVDGRARWADDPAESKDFWQFDSPGTELAPNLLGRQGDGIELRIFTRYKEGAFDATAWDPTKGSGDRGGANDWKRAPRVELIGVDWIGGPTRLEYEEWQ